MRERSTGLAAANSLVLPSGDARTTEALMGNWRGTLLLLNQPAETDTLVGIAEIGDREQLPYLLGHWTLRCRP